MPAVSDPGAHVAARYDVVRSARWKDVARTHLAKQPQCVACRHPGAPVCVHHIFPFHFCVALGRPDLELDERNLVTLCGESDVHGAGDHHLLIGHFDDYESMNLHVRREAEHELHGMTATQLRASAKWIALARRRRPHLAVMEARMRKEFRTLMDETFPQP
jgi:hypothetical protein